MAIRLNGVAADETIIEVAVDRVPDGFRVLMLSPEISQAEATAANFEQALAGRGARLVCPVKAAS